MVIYLSLKIQTFFYYAFLSGGHTFWDTIENPDNMYYLIHEIFHTFGFEDATKTGRKNGIMNYPPEKPNKEDSQEIADSVFLKL